MPGMYVGYIQSAEIPVTELEICAAEETIGENGLPEGRRFRTEHGSESRKYRLVVEFKPLGHTPLKLADHAGGRTAMFLWAWGELLTGDGRKDVGWVEWNRNLRSSESS
jgi:hypothetical protein